MSAFQPGIYVKNGVERTAHTRRDAVALEFEGFRLVTRPEPDVEETSETETQETEGQNGGEQQPVDPKVTEPPADKPVPTPPPTKKD